MKHQATADGFKAFLTGKPRRRREARTGGKHFSLLGKWLKTEAARQFAADCAAIKH